MNEPQRCTAMIPSSNIWQGSSPCKNNAKPGTYLCGIHTPKVKKKTKHDRKWDAVHKLIELTNDHLEVDEIDKLLGIILFDNPDVNFKNKRIL